MRRRGHALIDRELYLPRSWTEDRDRCRAAGIPDETGFATKPRLAQVMLSRASAGAWAAGAASICGRRPVVADVLWACFADRHGSCRSSRWEAYQAACRDIRSVAEVPRARL
jgi:DDE superfamily endonuclease